MFHRVNFNPFFDFPQVVIFRKSDNKQAIYNGKYKNKNGMKTKHHLNINQLTYVFSHSTVIWVVIFNVQKQYVSGFQFERNFVKIRGLSGPEIAHLD